jgi:DNA helicase-2/ATP-dependent DNA helicase PcrA
VQYSDLQKNIFRFILDSKDSLSIRAVAGSGKTTTLVTAAKIIPAAQSQAFLAFNKAIAEELRTRLPERVHVKTFNAVGHAALMRTGRKFNENKLRKIMDDLKSSIPFTLRKHSADIFRLVSLAKSEGLIPKGIKGVETVNKGLIPDSDESWRDLVFHYGLDCSSEDQSNINAICRQARSALIESLKRNAEFDFSDQIYLAFAFNLPLAKFDVLFIDEAQDVSQIQHFFIDNMLKTSGRLIACGDPDQAIYGFRGADSESMRRIIDRYKCKELPLSISYRCPVSVIQEAQKFVPQIQAREGADMGVVKIYHGAHPENLTKDDMILSRYNANLIKVALDLLERDVKFTYQGEDLSKEIVKLITTAKARTIDALNDVVEDKIKEAEESLEEAYDPSRISRFIDACRICLAFIRIKNPLDLQDLVAEVEAFFKNAKLAKNGVLLSTVHRAKGLEADRVFLLERETKKKRENKKDWLRQQESNTTYVAITRAKKELHIITVPEEGSEIDLEIREEDIPNRV